MRTDKKSLLRIGFSKEIKSIYVDENETVQRINMEGISPNSNI